MADEQKANVVLTADNRQYDRSMQQSAQATNSLLQSVVALSNGMNKLAQSTGKKMQLVSAGGVAGLAAATAAAAKFDSQMSTMQANAVLTGRSVDQMAKNVNSLRGTFAVTTDQAIALQTQLTKMGQTQGIDKISASMLKLGAVTGESVGALTQSMVSLQRQMGVMGPQSTERLSAALANVSAKSGVAATSVLDFSNAIAPISKVAGLSTKEVMGFSAAFVKAGQDGGQAMTAFNSLLTNITRATQYGSPELKAYSNLLGVSVKQFKEMPKSEAVIRIFEQINKQGPGAIKTLDRFGLDGIRTFKALQAMAQQGGIRQAMGQVAEGFDEKGVKKFDDASKAAMDGLNDQLQTLGNNLARVGASFGAAFVQPAQDVVSGINAIMNPLAGLLESLGNIPGLAAAAGVAFMGMAGTIVRSLGLLTGLSALRMMTGGTAAAGFRYTRAQMNGTAPPAFAARAAATHAANGGRGLQRWFFNAGQRAAGVLPTNPGGVGGVGPNAASRWGAWALRGVGGFTRMGLENLYARNVWNPFNTGRNGPVTVGDNWRARRNEVGRSWSNLRTGIQEHAQRTIANTSPTGFMGRHFSDTTRQDMSARAEQTAAARRANAELNALGRASRNQVGFFRTLGRESLSLGAALAKASGGAMMMAGRGGAMMAGGAANLGMKAIGGIASFLGPWGLAIGGGMLAAGAYRGYKQNQEDIRLASSEASPEQATGGAYKVALNHAARATTTFADIVLNQANRIASADEKPGVVSDTMVTEAMKPGRKFTDKRFGSMSYDEAKSYVQTTQLSQSDDERVLMGYDLIKAYGKEKAQKLLDLQDPKNPSMNLTGLFSGLTGEREGWSPSNAFKVVTPITKDALAAQGQATATTASNLAEIQAKYGSSDKTAANRYVVATLNAAMQSMNKGGSKDQAFSALADSLGIEVNDENWNQFEQLLGSGTRRVTKNGVTSMESDPRSIGRMERLLSSQPGKFDTGFGKTISEALRNAGTDFDRNSATWYPYQSNAPVKQWNSLTNIDEHMLGPLRSSAFGAKVFQNGSLGKNINAAIGAEADPNLQQRAMRQLADEAIRSTDGFSQASREMMNFKAAVGDANNPLYQLAANAQAVVAQRQSEAMHYMSRSGQVGQIRSNFITARANADAHPDSPEAEAEAEQARQALEGQKAAAYDTFKGIVQAQKMMEIQQGRAQKAFDLQKSQGQTDYDLQRERSQEDFDRSRARQEDSYGRQLTRQVRDYNKQRMWGQQAFDKQRRRSEEEYQHQVKLMTEQTARAVMNVYERINTQRTWDSANLMVNMQEQQSSLQGQLNNLDTVRGLGVSSDVIKMLGLNEAQNAQQLARFTADLMESPETVKAWNDAAKRRLAAAKELVTDEDNTQWQEMQRSFKRSTEHAIEDFNTSMNQQAESFATGLRDMRSEYNIATTQAEDDFSRMRARQATDFATSVNRMTTAFDLQMQQARDDLSTSAEEITGTFEELSDRAINGLNGTAKTQLTALKSHFGSTATEVKKLAGTLVKELSGIFSGFGVEITPETIKANQDKFNKRHGMYAGGSVPGHSPHPKADNIPAMLTAGEYVQPVETVNHYGQGFMEAVRSKRFPKEAAQRYADGGLVSFGRRIQGMGYQVGEHPLFGGVDPVHTKGSWHYKAGAIDVNHDQGDEKSAINKIVQMAREYGLRTIWQVANHFDHAHFDVSPGPDMIGPGVPRGKRGVAGSGEDPLFQQIAGLRSVKQLEKMISSIPAVDQEMPDNYFARTLADMLNSGVAPGDVMKMVGPSDTRRKANAALGKKMAAARGWTGPNWDALNWIYMKESGWDQFADNPTSDAYGIPQSLPGSKMASAGADWRTNPATQIKWGLNYIDERYGNPVKAQQFWKAHNWYGDGAIFNGGAQKVVGLGERGPEMVLPLNQQGVDYMLAVMQQYSAADAKRAVGAARGVPTQSAGSTSYYSRVDRSTNINGPITVQSNDPRDMLRKLEGEKRIAALTSPRSHS